jgi:peptidoglycan hydrolase-like protein with peptidoglycan-binding domain
MYGKPVPAAIAKGTGRYYGSIDGPGNSLGGFNAAERPAIKLIQQQLIFLGFVPGQTNINSGWADGIFDTKGGGVGRGPTSQAVTRFQKKYMPNTQYYGQVWYDDWQKLASM